MELGMVGLGKMGANMTRRLLRGGHRVVVFDLRAEAVRELQADGATGAASLAELIDALQAPRTVWIMVPSGKITEETIQSLADLLAPGDTVIDGGNSNYKDSQRRAAMLKARGLNLIDVGTSGGIWGLTERVQSDDRRRTRNRRTASPVLRNARTRTGQGLGLCRTRGRRAFCQDDSQWD